MDQFTPLELQVMERGLKALQAKPLTSQEKATANRLSRNIRAYQSGMPF